MLLLAGLDAIDSLSLIITFVGYGIVFIALVMLYTVFNSLPKLLNLKLKRKLRAKGKPEEQVNEEINITGEINAAIGMALHMYFSELHDEESNIITIEKISRRYSPWSSKIYGVRNSAMMNAYKKSQR